METEDDRLPDIAQTRTHDNSPSPANASANRAKAGMDPEPIFCMLLARWVSTVRWLIPKAMNEELLASKEELQSL